MLQLSALADRVPWDVADAILAWMRGRAWWAHLEAGGTWAGFHLTTSPTPVAANKSTPKFASQDGEPTVVPIEEVAGLSRAYRKEAEKARAAARDGIDRPTRPAAVGHIPILRSEALTIVPMKLLELW